MTLRSTAVTDSFGGFFFLATPHDVIKCGANQSTSGHNPARLLDFGEGDGKRREPSASCSPYLGSRHNAASKGGVLLFLMLPAGLWENGLSWPEPPAMHVCDSVHLSDNHEGSWNRSSHYSQRDHLRGKLCFPKLFVPTTAGTFRFRLSPRAVLTSSRISCRRSMVSLVSIFPDCRKEARLARKTKATASSWDCFVLPPMQL